MKNRQTFIITAILILQLAVLMATTAKAASGDLDTTFGSGGMFQFPNYYPNSHYPNAVVIQPDDKIIVAESSVTNNGANHYVGLRRYVSNGFSDDSSFGVGYGYSMFAPISGGTATAVALQPNGKILLAASSNSDFYILRFTPDGLFDTSFGNNGLVTTDFSGGVDGAYDVAVRGDGKIIVAGYATFGSDKKFAVARYNSNGTLDTSFSGNGKMVTGWGEGENYAAAVALLPNNKILLGGTAIINGHHSFALAQFNNNGSLDTGFGSGGQVSTNFGTQSYLSDIAVQPNGKILAVGGVPANCKNEDVALARYNTNGSPDTTFGTGGKVSVHRDNNHSVCGYETYDAVLQPDGKIVIDGFGSNPATEYLFLARFNPSGALDSGFGNNGFVLQDPAGNQGRAIGLQSDGKIIALGTSYLMRFLP